MRDGSRCPGPALGMDGEQPERTNDDTAPGDGNDDDAATALALT